MTGIVIQLQLEALDESVNIETLLRKAYLVARKLQLKDFETWIQNEQNGYFSNVPGYRRISGTVKAWNPYYGWTAVVAEGKIADFLNKSPIGDPISVIADAYKSENNIISFRVNGQLTELLNKNTTGLPTNYSFQTSKAELRQILSAVRNKILEWSIMLEENGIIGEGVYFSEQEKQTAKTSSTIYNYINNFYSNVDNTQIQQGGVENEIH